MKKNYYIIENHQTGVVEIKTLDEGHKSTIQRLYEELRDVEDELKTITTKNKEEYIRLQLIRKRIKYALNDTYGSKLNIKHMKD